MNCCTFEDDNAFGPVVVSCRDGFDFTLFFEQSILSLVPSAMISVCSAGVVLYLMRQNEKTKPATNWPFRVTKQIPVLAFVATQLALVVLWSSPSNHPTRVSVPASALSLVSGLLLAILSFFEHTRSVRPSALLNLYLVLSTLLDVVQSRTLWLREGNRSIAAVFTTGLALKVVFLGTEIIEKGKILEAPYSSYPPEALAGLLNRSVFWWINSLLMKGSSLRLGMDDLFALEPKLTSDRIQPKFQTRWESTSTSSPNSLLVATLQFFRFKILTIVVFRLGLIGFKFSQPLLITRAVLLLQEPETLEKRNTGRSLIGATSLIYIGIALTTGLFRHQVYRLITMIRSALVGLIYHTTLSLDAEIANDSAALTLMSTDIESIASGFEVFDSLWANPIEIAIAIYLLYNEIGLAFIAPIITALVFISVPIALRDVSAAAQKEWLQAIERRVATTADVLSNMKGVKMMGLTDLAGDKLQALRVHELRVAGKFRKMLALSVIIGTISHVAIPVIALITYVLIIRSHGMEAFSASRAFTALSLVSLLAYPIQSIAKALPTLAAASGCFQRIQKYVTSSQFEKMEESPGPNNEKSAALETKTPGSVTPEKDDMVVVRDADFATKTAKVTLLRNINISIRPSSWTVITGPVGSGKSVLLLALLDELHLSKGSIHRHASLNQGVGYCAQEPWLPNVSIRDVICSPSIVEFDEVWYRTVTKACVLEADFDELPSGDRTEIGSNGISLSGGQKQRIGLARALYSRKSLLILDDVLSGLDATTEQALVDNVFGSGGLTQKHGTTVILATHSVRHVTRADHVVVLGKRGIIVDQGSPVHVAHHFSDIDSASSNTSNAQASLGSDKSTVSEVSTPNQGDHGVPENQDIDHDMSRQAGDFRLYAYYFRSLGWINTIGMTLSILTYSVFQKFPTLWVQWWTEAEAKEPGKRTDMYAGVYGAFCGICLTCFSITIFTLFQLGIPRSSNSLHEKMLKTTMNAPYWFLVSTDTGNIVNRFSQDMSLVCMQLPVAFVDTLFNAGVCLIGGVLITLGSRWALTIYPALIVILYALQKFYLRTSRQMRLLDLEAKAPLYSYLMETLRGIITIKAFGWQSFTAEQNSLLLDNSQKPFYLMYSIQRWLNLVLDLLVAGVATLIVALATQLKDSSAGALGVSLLNILTFSQDLTYLIRTWTDLETSLGAISRVRSFETDTPCEHSLHEKAEPPIDWPTHGEVEFINLSANYKGGGPHVLKNLSLRIPAGSKVGICGRTGSGKSTMLLTLLRLAEIDGGDILIDGVSISRLPRNTIRQRAVAVPQDPLLLPGTIRFNADPFSRYQDDEILSTLGDLGLLDMVKSIEGELDAPMETLSLSRGQKQLFCLGRALLDNSRIVILDEMTSSVDSATEATMMRLVNERAVGKTVLAVAHHLHTIRDFDMILVLDQGQLVEAGSPDELLAKQGVFAELWNR